ncbi:hypothetical protein [Lentibacillus juripiscarius]|uniref:Uncharacterized protein n=1 Tax=Lentibacillus juripiscarius TaxID=257446 RepID=A0ABW5V8R1_9BACI
MNNNLDDILQNIDNKREGLAEFEIAQKIKKEFNGDQNNDAYLSELSGLSMFTNFSFNFKW